jgi:hypothetical protein
MSLTFTKLFSSITESTVWCEPAHTRLVWITMLAMADRQGRVWASVPGLANRARVPIEDTEKALDTFLSPDKYSRTADHDGRRIEVIDGGWRLLNYAKYREVRDQEDRREYQRIWDREHRGKNPTKSDKSDKTRPGTTKAEAEAEAENKKHLSGKPDAPSGFDRFWAAWPVTKRKGGKAKCLGIWKRKGLEAKADAIVAHVEAMKASADWKAGFEPMPTTYLNQDRWDGADLQAPASGEKPWFINGWSGIVAKGIEFGLSEKDYRTPPEFRAAVLKAAGITPEKVAQAEAEWRP